MLIEQEVKPFSCKKGVSERYDIRIQDRSNCWAIFTISENGGIFSVTSDHGEYSYNWPCHGSPSLKHFLIKIDTDYLLGKISSKSEFNAKETLARWQQEVFTALDDGALTVDEARKAQETIASLRNETDLETITAVAYDCEALSKIFDPYPDVVKEWDGQAVQFVRRLWGPFIEILKKEISGEFNEQLLRSGVLGGQSEDLGPGGTRNVGCDLVGRAAGCP